MAAPKGNQFWKARSSHGRKPIFASPDQLWTACEEYFQWVEEHPLWEAKAFSFQGDVTVAEIPKMRAMTIGGLCLFLDIDESTWKEYGIREGFTGIVTRAERVIRDQKFSGAAAELLNSNIIARDLGLRDKQDHEHTGSNGDPLIPKEVSELEVARRIAYILATATNRKDE